MELIIYTAATIILITLIAFVLIRERNKIGKERVEAIREIIKIISDCYSQERSRQHRPIESKPRWLEIFLAQKEL